MNKHIQTGWAIYLCAASAQILLRQRQLIQHTLLNPSEMPLLVEFVDNNRRRTNFQHLLEAARSGRFSHLAVPGAEVLGIHQTEALQAIDDLIELGITVRLADASTIDPCDVDDRVLIALGFILREREMVIDSSGGLDIEALNLDPSDADDCVLMSLAVTLKQYEAEVLAKRDLQRSLMDMDEEDKHG